MVQKKLNFNQPILSVRRYSPKMPSQIVDERKDSNSLPIIHSLPPHTPESNSGHVRNPGSVPFIWEQIPGRPKEEILAQGAKIYSFDSAELPPNEMEALQKTSIIFKSTDCGECREAVVDGVDSLHETDDLGVKASKARNQQQEQRRKVVYQDKPILVHCRPKKGSDDGGDQHENVITVRCLLPRSCLKSPSCVNPVPAMRVMNRIMTFPLSGSSADSENEQCAVKPIDKIKTYELKLEDNQHEDGPYFEEFPWTRSFKTLQELLADEEGAKEKKFYVDDMNKVEGDDTESDEVERNMISDSEKDWSSEDDVVRVAVKNARKQQQLSRATTLGSDVPPPPPLPESPTDSWLSRTLSSSASVKKGSSSTSMSRFSNKC